MVSQQLSFHIIKCPAGVSSPHPRLVVSGRGAPHETLTVYYEELQKTCFAPTMRTLLYPLLSFFTFLEQPEQHVWTEASSHESCSPCRSALERQLLPLRTHWAGPPSEIRVIVRAYLLARWGCLTRAHGQHEEILLSPRLREAGEIQRFLVALRQFYHFAIERRDYWYDGNPADAFRLPLRSRLRKAIAHISCTFRWRTTRDQSRVDEGFQEEPAQRINPVSLREKQPLPLVTLETLIQFVPVLEDVETTYS
jgi:hypothetical protein